MWVARPGAVFFDLPLPVASVYSTFLQEYDMCYYKDSMYI